MGLHGRTAIDRHTKNAYLFPGHNGTQPLWVVVMKNCHGRLHTHKVVLLDLLLTYLNGALLHDDGGVNTEGSLMPSVMLT